jgi:hypothetical protein
LGKTGSYTIPENVKQIGYSAFDGCIGLTAITFPSTLTGIGNYAFEYCTGLTKIQIPKNTINIANGAFYSCTNLSEISISNAKPPVVDYYTFDLVNKTTCKLIVPTGSASSYLAANYWKEFTLLSEQDFFDDLKADKYNEIKIARVGKTLIIKGINLPDKITVYNLLGMQLYSIKPIENQVDIFINNPGVYILNVGNYSTKIRIN